MAGYNLPDGVSESSKTAPWNQPDPWAGKTCGECRQSALCYMIDGTKTLVCAGSGCNEVFEVRGSNAACEAFR